MAQPGGVTHAATPNHPEPNKLLIQRFFDEAINAGELDTIDRLLAASFVDRSAGQDQLSGRNGIKQRFRALRATAPGLEVHIEALIAEGDLVAVHARWSGSHPPKGRHLLGTTLHLFRIDDGLILEAWGTGWELAGLQFRIGEEMPM
jgi:predicted SnoaL-like aldol condensation-catalyzing enzyme